VRTLSPAKIVDKKLREIPVRGGLRQFVFTPVKLLLSSTSIMHVPLLKLTKIALGIGLGSEAWT
jgi:hypothetical protein